MDPFSLPIRVYLEDTDAGGVVFYANYLKFFERSRTELVRTQGFEMRRSLSDGVSFVVASLNINYRKSAYLDDELLIFTEVLEIKRSYFDVKQWVERVGEKGVTLVEAQVRVACVDLDSGRPQGMPKQLVSALQGVS